MQKTDDIYGYIRNIPMLQVLEKCGIRYQRYWSCVKLYDGDSCSSGRILNLQGNYVNDFSHNRAKGGPFSFVQQLFGFTPKETIEWFEFNF